jgi:uncharacterized phage protein (TIGR02218 family)
MSFSEREVSNYSGQPVLLYDFSRGAMHWRYCTAAEDITLEGANYEAVPVSDGGVVQSGDTNADTFEVTLPAASAVAQLYAGTPPSDPLTLVVRRLHFGDADAPAIWSGRVLTCTQNDEAQATLACQSLISLFATDGLRLAWQRTCPHMLYDSECRVDKAAYAVRLVVSVAATLTLQLDGADAFESGYFAGGWIEWEVAPGTLERRMVEAHVGNQFGMAGVTDGITAGLSVTAYPGCSRTADVCNGRFNNIGNYGGILHLPGKSPFNGEAVF